jgi:nitrogen-specific signal transduction histidine kinase
MFEPLVTGKPDGAGLGLFIARDVAQRHGGRIHWHRRNSMTSFVVELPTAQPQPSNASKRSLAADMPRTTGGLRRAAD